MSYWLIDVSYLAEPTNCTTKVYLSTENHSKVLTLLCPNIQPVTCSIPGIALCSIQKAFCPVENRVPAASSKGYYFVLPSTRGVVQSRHIVGVVISAITALVGVDISGTLS